MTAMRVDTGADSREAHKAETAAFVADEATRLALVSALGSSASTALVVLGGIEDAIAHLARDPSPRLVVVDLAGAIEPLQILDRLAEVCPPETAVVAIGEVNDVGLYRALLSAGVADYLVKPIAPETLKNSIDLARRRLHGHSQEKPGEARGKIFIVVGARGGVGATTIASTLAWIFAEEHKQRSILVDLDLYWGAAALSLDVEPNHGLCEALERPNRIDSLLVASAATTLTDNLYLLCSEEPVDQPVVIGPAAVKYLCTELRRTFERIVIDVPRNNPELLRESFHEADKIVVAADLSLPGLRDTVRILSLAKSAAPTAKIFVVASRAAGTPQSEISRAEFQKSIGMPIAVLVPHDGKAVPAAANTGKPLPQAASRSKATAALRTLAGILGEPQAVSGKGLLGWLRSTAKVKEA